MPASHSPLSRQQQFFWVRQQAHPALPFYTIPFVFRIRGALDTKRFRQAFQALLDQTDGLRTVIRTIDDDASLVVREPYPFDVPFYDVSAHAKPTHAVAQWYEDHIHLPLAYDTRLFDTALLKVGEDDYRWYLRQHHLITDGWTTRLLFERMAQAYTRIAPLPALPVYDPARIEAALQHKPAYARAKAFWQAQLSEPLEPLTYYRAAPANRTLEEVRMTWTMSPDLTTALHQQARRFLPGALGDHLATHTLLQAALLATLHRLHGYQRLAIGTLLHNRITARERGTLGLLQATYPLVADLEEGETLVTLAQQCLRRMHDLWRHRHYLPGTMRYQSAFDVLFNYLPFSFPAFDGHSVEAEWLHTGVGDGHRSLSVIVQDFQAADTLTVHFDFNQGAFDTLARERFMAHMEQVLVQGLENPHQPLSRLHLFTPAEAQQLASWNATAVPLPTNDTVVRRFEAQVARTPHGIALEKDSSRYTYEVLNQQANQLAQWLQQKGVGKGTVVGCCLDRSPQAMMGLLAVLKSGAAYLPLDPAYPSDRLAFMIRDAGVSVLLTETTLRALLPDTGAALYDLNTLSLPDEPIPNPDRTIDPGEACYLIYTSGSTGRPKGVVMPHRALVNLIAWQMDEATRLTQPRTLQYTPLSFDVSLQEIFACWCSGGTLILLDEVTRRHPAALLETLDKAAIEQLYLTPTALQQLAQAADTAGYTPAALREVISAGEALTITPAIRHFFARHTNIRLQNQYGPSETHIVTGMTLPNKPDTWPVHPSIGYPLWNTTAYILDHDLRPVPHGVAGELFIGGVQVATGYLLRPELTEARFLPDPLVPGTTMYKTGDQARFLPDGAIHFMGRLDHQVKVNGYRIELGEIEALLTAHVAEAVAVVRNEPDTAPYIAAYYRPHRTHPVTATALREALERQVPAYMVPTAFVEVDTFPLTPSGKVNRRALPVPEAHDSPAAFETPRSLMEGHVAAVWQQVLDLPRVGRHDHFFALGGDSMRLVQVYDLLKKHHAPDLSLLDLFKYTTVHTLARHLDSTAAPQALAASDPVAARAARQQAALHRLSRKP